MRRHWVLPTLLSVALVAVGVWGFTQYNQRLQYRTYLENQYQKSFYELVDNVGNLEVKLSKMMVTATPSQNILLLTDIWRQSNAAQQNLGQLPISHQVLGKTSKFINQLGDFCYSLSKGAADGKTIGRKDMEQLQTLYNNSVALNGELRSLENQINSGGVQWGEIHRKGSRQLQDVPGDLVSQEFSQIEKTALDYPTLIYDGPFSESLDKAVPKGLGKRDVSLEEAQNIALEFLGRDRIGEISKASEGNGKIKTWGFQAVARDTNHPINIHITKKGGHVLWMIENAGTPAPKLSIDQCAKNASNFLENHGIKNMISTYKQHYNGVVVINFAGQEGDVILYPDLVKVKVSMEDGSIIGYEAQNYLMSHTHRKLPKPEISQEEARELVSSNLKIQSIRLAVIPTETMGEKLCYEFKGTFGKENFIVYINAVTGKEEDILKIIDTDNGNLVL